MSFEFTLDHGVFGSILNLIKYDDGFDRGYLYEFHIGNPTWADQNGWLVDNGFAVVVSIECMICTSKLTDEGYEFMLFHML